MINNDSIQKYFFKEDQELLTPGRKIIESNYIDFSIVLIIVLSLFSIVNFSVQFMEAFWINFLSGMITVIGLFVFKKTKMFIFPLSLLIFTALFVLFGQQIIINVESYHNMLFLPSLAVISFALMDNIKLAKLYTVIVAIVGAGAYFISKHGSFVIRNLSSQEIDMYLGISIVASMFSIYRILKCIYKQRQDAYEQLDKSNEDLKEVLVRNKKLMALLVHDIANPVSVMNLTAELIRKSIQKEESDKLDKMFNRYFNASESISDIIKTARTIIANDSGKMQLNIENRCLKTVLENSIKDFGQLLDSKSLKIKLSTHGDYFNANIDKIAIRYSVFGNVISNAIKFSKKNSIIEIEISELESKIHIKITDSGVGMSSDLRSKVFSSHEVTSRPGTDGEKGTGFGMPLAKSFTDACGGSIEVISNENTGTTFSIYFNKS
jgi:signal transduction histidine kinase